jgi:phage tail-like protein
MTPSGSSPPLALEPAFSVKIGPFRLGTFTECSGLGAEHETYPYAEGGNNFFVHTLVGRLHHPNVTLKGGVTDQTMLLDWVLGQGPLGGGPQNVTITFRNADGSALRSFQLAGAVPVKWSGPSGNAGANAVATETLEIAHQGLVG